MTKNMTLRLPDDLDSLLRSSAAKNKVSKHELIINTLYAQFDSEYDADMVLGWFKMDKVADIDLDSDCPGCASRDFIDEIWFGITGANQIIGPFCSSCADSE